MSNSTSTTITTAPPVPDTAELTLTFTVPTAIRGLFEANLETYLDQMEPMLTWLADKGGQMQRRASSRDTL